MPDNSEHIAVKRMLKEYPMFCETQCCAWNKYSGNCNGPIMGRSLCAWTVNKITTRISDKKRIAGDKWWKTPKGGSNGNTSKDTSVAFD